MLTKVFRVLRLSLFVCIASATSLFAQAAPASASQTFAPVPASAKLYFLVRLTPPRPTFPKDMTTDERTLMGKHVVYWTALFNAGKVLLFGPVQDSKGDFSMAVVEAASREEAQSMVDNDPAAQVGMKTELSPMQVRLHR